MSNIPPPPPDSRKKRLERISYRKARQTQRSRLLLLLYSSLVLSLLLAITFVPSSYLTFVNFIEQTNTYLLISSIGSLGIFAALFYRIYIDRYETSFQDIDIERKDKSSSSTQKNALRNIVTGNSVTIADHPKERKVEQCRSQYNLFIKINDDLTSQIQLFDEKASKMLDQGISKASFGVVFLISSIIAWQILFFFTDKIDARHYAGIVSCSLIFIFMQALAAWCLKQHRAYVDASLYVTKIRSIFERKMQAYLLIKEHADDKDAYHKLLDNFLEDISWPPEPLSAKQQTSYTKEAAETLTEVTKALKVLQPAQGKSPRPSRKHSSPYSRN
ncbi:hypothetical protein [Halodesulfovibrio spirochaetisodalis]|uniref:hypothetical protein n=1 Tax=Halodesulfovibrio spirochaetisodalis TaxID=1560234 RepID=UPI00082D2381|nr:hypothetical protein [Halodesulfovibrio spirochaetisodalis]